MTADHPFWVDAGEGLAQPGWIAAGNLRPGDVLRTATGPGVVVEGLRRGVGRAVVYTLTVAKDHTFFVGQARVLVHNSLGCFRPGEKPKLSEITFDWNHIFDQHDAEAAVRHADTTGIRTVFGGLGHGQIEQLVKAAYRNARTVVARQPGRIVIRGEAGGWTIEMVLLQGRDFVRSAYPVLPGKQPIR